LVHIIINTHYFLVHIVYLYDLIVLITKEPIEALSFLILCLMSPNKCTLWGLHMILLRNQLIAWHLLYYSFMIDGLIIHSLDVPILLFQVNCYYFQEIIHLKNDKGWVWSICLIF
jgi:hypothetical protein